eukprot:scaffold295121_cov31-Tisochrysis_lutea.AAC.1
MADDEFYLRYYVGHKGKFGHEFLEFEFRPDGRMRYANNSNYKNDTMIRKEETDPVVCPSLCVCRDHEAYVSQAVLAELKRIVDEAEVVREDDNQWPEPDRNGRQVCSAFLRDGHGLCRLRKTAKGNLPVYHASCCERPLMTISRKIGSLLDVQESKDPEGLRVFYYLIQDLKCMDHTERVRLLQACGGAEPPFIREYENVTLTCLA